ncbi:choline transport protein, putative [Talaromyces stipitatus ATCC 10500]|uniref:Choline transport protein, putative n=1 Tax=Talaromyces stipitatus (strain ATCC 10500 / CBS 375.48 / QM 6759 / NRRL 1006) TaxID=441959 RepID=B8M2S6_TALSN|nr:choline transport protein, putative [Talaromyces stipitatus ATCC 10500]EED22181.1 choline transport protein, putative [Talaromyces stipitatus ATCC 10500]
MSADIIPKNFEAEESPVDDKAVGDVVNASGHKQELQRNFGLLSICAIAVTTGNTWIAQGGSVTVNIANGGPAGIIYEFIAVSICYWLVAASIAELASAMPSASGVYHWASVTAGKYGRPCGWFAGWWNTLAWVFGAASMSSILGNQTVSMYALFHPEFEPKAWHVFVSMLICTWICCLTVMFANKVLPQIGNLGMFLILGGVFVTIIVCAVMPHINGLPYASNEFVWASWTSSTGYSSQGFVFVAGMLNGAYSVGTPDVTSHLAEEIPHPSRNIPKAMLAQMSIGFITGFLYMIAMFYSIQSLDDVLNSVFGFPLAEIYRQATGSRGGALGLLIVAFLPTLITCIGCYITAGRTLWTLARDNATPFPSFVGHINTRFHNPLNATFVCGCMITVLACIYVGSTTAFNAFIGSYIQLSTLSYFTAIFPHVLTRRSLITPGYFHMKNSVGYVVNILSCIYIVAFIIIFCFPYAIPTNAKSMNYASLITGGLTIFIAIWWFIRQRDYVGPQAIPLADRKVAEDAK